MCVCYRTSWEFPEIVIGKYRMISDADGKQYPWYGSKTEVQTLEGPTMQPTHVTIHMNDNFFPQVRLYISHPYRCCCVIYSPSPGTDLKCCDDDGDDDDRLFVYCKTVTTQLQL